MGRTWIVFQATGSYHFKTRRNVLFDSVSGVRAFTQLDATLGYAPGWLDPKLTWHLGVSLGGAGDRAFQSWDSEIQVLSLSAMAGYSYEPFSILRLHGRGGLALDWATLTIAGMTSAGALEDDALSFGLAGVLGLELVAARSEGEWEFSLLAEGGYGQRLNDLRFNELAPEVETTEPPPIAIGDVDGGGLNLSGPFWRLGAALRF